MPSQTSYTLSKVAKLLEISEADVSRLISVGVLKATFMDNIGSHIVTQDAVVSYLKSKRDYAKIRKIMPSRVILVDRDSNVQSLLSAELHRMGVEFKVATEPNELSRSVLDFSPDLIAVHLFSTTRASESVTDVLKRAREDKYCRIVLFYDDSHTAARDATIRQHIQDIAPDETIVTSGRVSHLVDAIKGLLGLK